MQKRAPAWKKYIAAGSGSSNLYQLYQEAGTFSFYRKPFTLGRILLYGPFFLAEVDDLCLSMWKYNKFVGHYYIRIGNAT